MRKADAIDAVIVDSEGHDVRTLARGNRRPVGRTVLRWDGRDDAGAIVPDGEYRLRLRFAKADRTILIPDIIEVDTHRPALELLSLAPRELEPDRHEVTIKLRLSEQARVLVLADGELVLSGALSDRGTTTLAWDASALSPGRHLVTLQGQDLAGNLSAPTEGVTVTVRAGA